jgi:hypothetical protein
MRWDNEMSGESEFSEAFVSFYVGLHVAVELVLALMILFIFWNTDLFHLVIIIKIQIVICWLLLKKIDIQIYARRSFLISSTIFFPILIIHFFDWMLMSFLFFGLHRSTYSLEHTEFGFRSVFCVRWCSQVGCSSNWVNLVDFRSNLDAILFTL